MQAYKRSQRVGELILHELSNVMLELKTGDIGFVTFLGVKLTDDLQDARIAYSIIGEEVVIEKTHEYLKKMTPHIRHQLAQRLNLRRMPTIVFVYDTSAQKAAKVFEILEKLQHEND